jgi:hypothetical protein
MASISLKYKSKQGNLTAPGDVDPGAMIPIATVTVGSGGSSTITFSDIPQNYEHLQLRAFVGNSSSYATLRFNSDTTTSNYRHHYIYGSGSSALAGTIANNAYFPSTGITGAYGGIMDILDYSNTNKYKTCRVIEGYDNNTGGGNIYFTSNLWMSTNAITSFTLTNNSGNFPQYSSFALYGIKRAGA